MAIHQAFLLILIRRKILETINKNPKKFPNKRSRCAWGYESSGSELLIISPIIDKLIPIIIITQAAIFVFIGRGSF
jgi:hypothetical protein